MPCERIQASGVVMVCWHGGKSRKKCRWCNLLAEFLCDHVAQVGLLPGAKAETCDAPICHKHAIEVGQDRHYCPRHAPMPAPASAMAGPTTEEYWHSILNNCEGGLREL